MKKYCWMFILLLAVILSSCYADRMLEYYADESNFQTITGTVTYVGFSDDRQTLYLSISNLPEGFSSETFEIVGKGNRNLGLITNQFYSFKGIIISYFVGQVSKLL